MGTYGVIQTSENTPSLANKSLDELGKEIVLVAEGSEQAKRYHDEIARRQQQADLDKATSELVTEKKKIFDLDDTRSGCGYFRRGRINATSKINWLR